jgi:hypothetical protein
MLKLVKIWEWNNIQEEEEKSKIKL